MTDTTATPIARARAVKDIAAALADRSAFVAMVSPDVLKTVAARLHLIPGWTAYLDSGTDIVMRTTDIAVVAVLDLLIDSAVVLTIPKTTPAATISEALGGTPVPEDGSQDIILLGGKEDAPMFWSLLFLDAIERVDPETAADIRAAAIANLN